MKRPEALAAHSGRVDLSLRNGTATQRERHNQEPPDLDTGRIPLIQKNKVEEIRVELSRFNGHDLVSIRDWAEPRDGGAERIPTKAAIACNVRLLPDLIETLRRAELHARDRGSL
jgi:hypothetical protein